MDKHSSLLQKFVNNGQNKFYNIGPRAQRYKTFYSHNLQIYVINQSFCPYQVSPGACTIKLLRPQFTDFRKKL
jgi:hypothetical protein